MHSEGVKVGCLFCACPPSPPHPCRWRSSWRCYSPHLRSSGQASWQLALQRSCLHTQQQSPSPWSCLQQQPAQQQGRLQQAQLQVRPRLLLPHRSQQRLQNRTQALRLQPLHNQCLRLWRWPRLGLQRRRRRQ